MQQVPATNEIKKYSDRQTDRQTDRYSPHRSVWSTAGAQGPNPQLAAPDGLTVLDKTAVVKVTAVPWDTPVHDDLSPLEGLRILPVAFRSYRANRVRVSWYQVWFVFCAHKVKSKTQRKRETGVQSRIEHVC